MDFEGKVALVTGGGRGIGKAAATKFAEGGADIVIADIDPHTAKDTAQGLSALGVRAVSISLDIGDIGQIESMVYEAVSKLGSVDILFNNAGLTRHISFFDIQEDHWHQINRVNAKGAFFCMQKVANQMVKQARGGRIINTASIAGKGYRRASNAAYAASKGAVIAMTHSAASVMAEYDVNVNAICPGIVQTDMLANILSLRSTELGASSEEVKAMMTEEIPLGRPNDADDVAALAVFLAGPGSRNITGQAFNVDGGMIMH
jgi:NAD(P)-dependent dehydrogenase (short-subunit alcohol dehydrogenase family)